MMKEEKAITLIALVVTIVVLLILAGVTIATLTGDNGIITRTNQAKEETTKATEKEQVQLAVIGAKGKNEGRDYSNADLQEELDDLAGEQKTEVTGEETFTVLFKETQNSYYVTEDGNVNQIANTNIYKYNAEGYITGIKDEYIEVVDNRYAEKETNIKYASLNKNLKLAIYADPSILYYLKEEVGTVLVIPSEIDGVKIKGIADGAFSTIYNLTDVIMADTIETIGEYAFNCCVVLKNVKLSANLTTIENRAFEDCFDLVNIELTYKIQEIGDYCFYQIGKEEIYIPGSVQKIGEHAFPFFDKIYCEVSEQPEGWDNSWNEGLTGSYRWLYRMGSNQINKIHIEKTLSSSREEWRKVYNKW